MNCKAVVAPRVAQAAMRHSNISLMMGTYTDARLLDTAEAIESLPLARSQPVGAEVSGGNSTGETGGNEVETGARKLAPTLAPNAVQTCHFGSMSDHSETRDTNGPETKKPQKTQGFPGFLVMGGTELESVTSTMSKFSRTTHFDGFFSVFFAV